MSADDELRSPTLSADAVAALTRPLALDLTAAYALMRDEALALVDRAKREGWTPDHFMLAVQAMLATDRPLT